MNNSIINKHYGTGHSPKNWAKIILALIAVLAVITSFISCSPAKHIAIANKKDPVAAAKWLRENAYPCTELLKRDTTTVIQDSIIWIECPQNGTEADYSDKGSGGKTGTSEPATNPQINKSEKVAIHIPVTVKYIDRWFEDSAKLYGLQNIIHVQDDLLNKKQDSIKTQIAVISERNKTINSRNKRELWMLGIIIVLGLWTCRKLFL